MPFLLFQSLILKQNRSLNKRGNTFAISTFNQNKQITFFLDRRHKIFLILLVLVLRINQLRIHNSLLQHLPYLANGKLFTNLVHKSTFAQQTNTNCTLHNTHYRNSRHTRRILNNPWRKKRRLLKRKNYLGSVKVFYVRFISLLNKRYRLSYLLFFVRL